MCIYLNRAEFVERVEGCQARLYRVALTVLGSGADAEDAVQEALIAAWRALGSLRDERLFETWLMRILINRCRGELRARARRAAPVPDEVLRAGGLPKDVPEPPDPGMYRALEQLDYKYRLPLMLSCAEGYSTDEIASMLRLPGGAVKWRIHQGRIKLRELLKKEGRIDE